jgi:CDP-diacylglycerol---serine O-phosphatidyltransferase
VPDLRARHGGERGVLFSSAHLYRPAVLGQDRGLLPKVAPLPPARVRKLDLRKTLFLLPNIITLSSVFCGFDSIRISGTATGDDDYYRASLLLVFALFFDTLDGRVARLTKTQSAFGLQIDSLADVISFGVAPALLVYKWSLWQWPLVGLIAAYLFAAAGAVRLARFNVLSMGDKGAPSKPGKYIVGLPVPGAAGILISLVLANHAMGELHLYGPKYVAGMVVLTIFLSFLMVSTIRFRSFKDVRLNARTFALVAFAVGSSAIVSLQTRPAFVLVWLLSCYVIIGLAESALALSRRAARRDANVRHPSSP